MRENLAAAFIIDDSADLFRRRVRLNNLDLAFDALAVLLATLLLDLLVVLDGLDELGLDESRLLLLCLGIRAAACALQVLDASLEVARHGTLFLADNLQLVLDVLTLYIVDVVERPLLQVANRRNIIIIPPNFVLNSSNLEMNESIRQHDFQIAMVEEEGRTAAVWQTSDVAGGASDPHLLRHTHTANQPPAAAFQDKMTHL